MIYTGRPEAMSKKRRNFTAQFKLETVLDGLRGEKTVAQICRERDITESLYYKWRDAFMERATDIFADQRGPQRDEQAERIAELERLAGKQALEIEILKKAGSVLESMRERNGR
jgi:transposase-like protein